MLTTIIQKLAPDALKTCRRWNINSDGTPDKTQDLWDLSTPATCDATMALVCVVNDSMSLPSGQQVYDAVQTFDADQAAKQVAAAEADKDDQVDFSKLDPFLKALAVALNDGTFIPGSDYTLAEMKAIVRAKL